MAEVREQINPKVAGTTKALLLRYCQEKHTTQGDVVDAALLAFLQPKAEDDLSMFQMDLLRSMEDSLRILVAKLAQLEVIEAKQDALLQGVAALVPLLTTIVERLEQPQPEPEPPPPIADYAQLYKELRAGFESAEEEAGESGPSEEGTLPEAPAAVAPEVIVPPPERRGWFFTRRTGS